MIEINKSLNLVIPIVRDDETVLYIHSSPIKYETFERYWKVLGKTYSEFTQHGFDPRSGPSIAAMCLKEVAQNTARGNGGNWYDGDDGVGGSAGLIAEIIRLSNVLVPQANRNGWSVTMLQTVIDQGMLTEREKNRAINLLVFFTVCSQVAPTVDAPKLIMGMAFVYELQTTLLTLTEFAASLKTLTTDANTGAKIKAS